MKQQLPGGMGHRAVWSLALMFGMSLIATASPPTILSQPRSAILSPGETVPDGMLEVGVDGSLPLTYQWQKYPWTIPPSFPSDWVPNGPTLYAGSIGPAEAGIYRAVISNSEGWIVSQEVVLGVNGFAISQQGPEPRRFDMAVELTPPGIGGAWRLDGESSWRESGDLATGLIGPRRVIFRPVAGFRQPTSTTIYGWLSSAEPLIGTYVAADPTAASGGLAFFIKPDGAGATELPLAERGQWRLLGESDSQWQDSGTVRTTLPAGEYLVECKPVAGWDTPVPVNVVVHPRETSTSGTVYVQSSEVVTVPWDLLDLETVQSAAGPCPYPCIGQVRSDKARGTGFAVGERAVVTAASVAFDESSFAIATDLRWYRNYHRDLLEPDGVQSYGVLMTGYADQRRSEDNPGQMSPGSQRLGVAVLCFVYGLQYKQFTGYLASDLAANPWLGSHSFKKMVGYPAHLPDPALVGRMHESPGSTQSFSRRSKGLYEASDFQADAGMAGAPLLVTHADGKLYPAGVVVEGSGLAVVRAIDTEVVRAILLAEKGAGDGTYATVGISLSSTTFGSSDDPAALKVTVDNVGDQGRWRIGPTGILRRNGDQIWGMAPGNCRIYFLPVEGLILPGRADSAFPEESYIDVYLVAGRLLSVGVDYGEIAISLADQSVPAFNEIMLSIRFRGTPPIGVEWFLDGVPISGAISNWPDTWLKIPRVTSAAAGVYTVRIDWEMGSQWSPPATLTVERVPQAIQWEIPGQDTREMAPVDLEATASSGLPVAFEVVSGPATVAGTLLNPHGVGLVSVRATQAGDADYLAADPLIRVLQIVPETLESWRQRNFGTTSDIGNAAAAADPDGDGKVNLEEYATGTNPNDGTEFFRVQAAFKIDTSLAITAVGKAGRIYVMERSTALSEDSWIAVVSVGPLPVDGPVMLADEAPPPQRGFYRLRVSVP